MPSTAYQIDNVPDDIDFNPLPGSTTIINSSDQLAQLSEPDASFLKEQLRENSLLEIQTADGRWTRNIYLPEGTELENKVIRFRSNAGYTSTVIYSGRNATISRGETWLFKYLAGQWVRDGELENQGLVYALNTWSVELPASWIKPGIALHFASGNLSGKLENIRVGAPTELLIHTIDIGMLTAPRNQFLFAQDPEAHREYFQTAPISRMIISNYQSLHLTEVMLPDGQLLTDFDPSQGGVHSGTMRQRIGKELISLGINHANYGINCSEGAGEWTPYLAGQLTAHNSVGKYANGTVIHGLSGGAGMVTLENSLGNEFSHEVGHNYDLVHYPGDFDGSVHQSADSINSTWGWDKDRRKFLPNFKPSITNKPSCYEGVCQATFHGRSFGFDPMAGGEPMASINRFTLHTPYTAGQAQEFMEKKVVFSADSATGFRKWDNNTQRMEPYFHRIDTVSGVTASNSDLSANTLTALFRTSGLVNVTMADGNWAKDINLPLASVENKDCIFTLRHQATYNSTLFINGTSIQVNSGFSKNFYSNGNIWQECLIINSHTTRTIASNEHLSHIFLTDLLSRFTLTQIILNDGDWVPIMEIPPASAQNNQRIISVENNALEESIIYINGLSIEILPGHKKLYISDGGRWLEEQVVVDISKPVKPKQFGVPVTTLVGYYDPQGILPDYIYPALHGAYGFIYNDDSDDLNDTDCQLWVESAEGLQRFKLDNSRIRSNVMNKFHINIAQSEQPQTVTIMRDGKAVCRRTIEPASTSLTWTVNGESDNAALPSPVEPSTAPGNLRCTAVTASGISLAWDAAVTRGTLESYSIFRSENGGVTSVIASVPASQLTYSDNGLKADTRYSYFAVAYDVEGRMSPKSNTLTLSTEALPVTAPTAPGNLRSTAVTASSISLVWDASVTNGSLESYSLFRSENGGITSVIASVPASQLTYRDTGLKAETRYSYFAVAYDVEGRMSPKSNTLTLSTEALPVTAPTAPGNLRSTAVTASSISLAWDASATRGTLESYSIFRSENGGVTSVIASVPASQLTYRDTGLKAETRY
ncbi:M66 family metalloprotease, partial [Erwinia sp. CGal63]